VSILKSSFAEFRFTSNLVIVKVYEGVDFGPAHLPELYKILNDKFDGDFAWISDKCFSYSVDLLIIPEIIKKFPNFKCCSNVTYGQQRKDNVVIAKPFFPPQMPINSFNSLNEAIQWSEETLKK
jgi:hypothetical protein